MASGGAAASRSCTRGRGPMTRRCPIRVSCTPDTSCAAADAAPDNLCTVGSTACDRAPRSRRTRCPGCPSVPVSSPLAGRACLVGRGLRLESEDPEALAAEYVTVLVGVGRQPRDEMPGAQRGLLLIGDVLERLSDRDDVAEARIRS